MLLSAVIQQKTQADAIAKQKRMAVESQQRALASQNQATDAAMKQVQEFEPEQRKNRQDEIQQDLTGQYEKAASGTPITAQGVQVGATIPESAAITVDQASAAASRSPRSWAASAVAARRSAEGVAVGAGVGLGSRLASCSRSQSGRVRRTRIAVRSPSAKSRIPREDRRRRRGPSRLGSMYMSTER